MIHGFRAGRVPRACVPSPPPLNTTAQPRLCARGEVAEWLNAPHSKCGIRATVSGVRIPPSPPINKINSLVRIISDISDRIKRRLSREAPSPTSRERPPYAKDASLGPFPVRPLDQSVRPCDGNGNFCMTQWQTNGPTPLARLLAASGQLAVPYLSRMPSTHARRGLRASRADSWYFSNHHRRSRLAVGGKSRRDAQTARRSDRITRSTGIRRQ